MFPTDYFNQVMVQEVTKSGEIYVLDQKIFGHRARI